MRYGSEEGPEGVRSPDDDARDARCLDRETDVDEGSPRRLIREVMDWADEGCKHGIPTCCGIRFGIEWERPKLGWFLEAPFLRPWVRWCRLNKSYRQVFALIDGQGYVPCEYHLVRWILTGKRPDIRQD